MKRLSLFLFLSVFFINAQEKGDIEIGANVGLNASHVTSFSGDPVTPKFGYNFAVSGEYFFSDQWGLKTKIIYDEKGWVDAFINNENISRDITDFRVNYLTIPFLVTLQLKPYDNWYMHLGPYFGFLLNAEAENAQVGTDLSYVFRGFDLGISYALGYKLEINKYMKLFAEFEISPGLINIFKIDNLNADYTVVNGRTSLNFGVLFDL